MPRAVGKGEVVLDAVAEREELEEVRDDASNDDTVSIKNYDITSFGADYDVEGLVRRLNKDEILIPGFQRGYVWTISEASRFIESLLLGLPVPGVFLARELGTNKQLVIDGQQRLRTLQFFYDGYFSPKASERTQKVFKLTNVQPEFEGKTYKSIDASTRLKLDNSIIHATIVKQESPAGEDTSLYHIFERLNYGGRRLAPQEIRVAIYHGKLLNLVKSVNGNEKWRKIYGRPSSRLKDQELILRFLAFHVMAEKYRRPMKDFINRFASIHRNPLPSLLAQWKERFEAAIGVVFDALGQKAFRPEASINAAVFDSVMLGVSRRLESGPIDDLMALKKNYTELMSYPKYKETVSRSTADEKFVKDRIAIATEKLGKVP